MAFKEFLHRGREKVQRRLDPTAGTTQLALQEKQEVSVGSVADRVTTDMFLYGFAHTIRVPEVVPSLEITGKQETREVPMFYIGPHGEPFTATLTAMETETGRSLELSLIDDDSTEEILIHRADGTQIQVVSSAQNQEAFIRRLSSARIDQERLQAEFRKRQRDARTNPNISISWNKGRSPSDIIEPRATQLPRRPFQNLQRVLFS